MASFRDNVFYLLLWRSIIVVLVTLVVATTRCLELRGALLIGANAALLFSLGLIAWSELLGGDRIIWTKAWRMLRPDERPAGVAGRTVAYDCLRGLALRFAEGASVAAAALSASALLLASD
jgi:hypothetical protein